MESFQTWCRLERMRLTKAAKLFVCQSFSFDRNSVPWKAFALQRVFENPRSCFQLSWIW